MVPVGPGPTHFVASIDSVLQRATMSVPLMAPAMARTELPSLPLAPATLDRLMRAGFRTLRDMEGVQPMDLSRGEASCSTIILLLLYFCVICVLVLALCFVADIMRVMSGVQNCGGSCKAGIAFF